MKNKVPLFRRFLCRPLKNATEETEMSDLQRYMIFRATLFRRVRVSEHR